MNMVGIWLMLLLPLIMWSLTRRRGSKKLPPGPANIPITGHRHLIGDQPHKSLAKLAETHGPVMSMKMDGKLLVVISSSAAAEQILRHQDLNFSNRSVPGVVSAKNHSKLSVMWLPVDTKWKLLRKMMTTHVFSCNRLDASQRMRSQKVNDLIIHCEKSCEAGEAVDIGELGFMISLNILSNVVFSRDWANGKEFKELVWEMLAASANMFPVYTQADLPRVSNTEAGRLVGKMLEMFRSRIAERLESTVHGTGSKDFLDALLELRREDPDEINESVIQHLFLDLFMAGTDTFSVTLEWAMTELLRNPMTLKKAQAELEEVIGRRKLVNDNDLPNLPYLQCILKESLRMHPPVPLLMPHKAGQDAEVCGYTIPSGSKVLVNAWAIGRDESNWEVPLEFKPERFLDLDRDFWGQDFELIPFGSGRRMCPGMPLVARAIPVVLGSLLNLFDWKLEEGVAPEEIDMEEKFVLTLQKAKPLRVIPIAY